jgi:capsular polysaccharide transport system permease protein
MKIFSLKTIDKYSNFLYLVVIPFVVISIYVVFIASDRFTSDAIVTIKENTGSGSGLDFGVLGLAGSSGQEDERIMKEYLLSGDMLNYLNNNIKHKNHYSGSGADWLSSLAPEATREEYLEYYRNHINIHFDEVSSLLFIEVQAFNPEYAQQILQSMLDNSEAAVNTFSQRLAEAQYLFLEQQLVVAQTSLKMAKQNLLEFQNRYKIFSPEHEGESLSAILDVLEGELSKEKAKLKELLGVQSDRSPQVMASKERVRALQGQIEDEKKRLVGEGDQQLNDLMLEYTNLQLELEFSKNAYTSTLAALEQAKADASNKMKSLVIVSKPSLADEAIYPDRSYILITTFLVLLMLFGILRMSISTIKEHLD